MFIRNFLFALLIGICFGLLTLFAIVSVAGSPLVQIVDINAASVKTWNGFSYSETQPIGYVIALSIGVALFMAGLFALIEYRATNKARRSFAGKAFPLSPRVQMHKTFDVFLGEVTVTTLVPAHNEEATIHETLVAMKSQTRKPDRVIVVADNCTDRTIEIAKSHGAEIFESVDNQLKKGGALNQILATLLPDMGHNDTVMVLDADTTLSPEFIEAAVARFTADRAIMAIGGIFKGDPGGGLLGLLQRNEYDRYERKINRRRGKVFVLTGTSTIFRSGALRTVAESRGTILGGTKGDVYDTVSLTEDNELTLALKSIGALMESPRKCVVHTELMPTWRDLWHQRMRWQRGALENIGSYGLTPATFRYWGQQLGIAYGVVSVNLFLVFLLITALAVEQWVWYPFWLGVGFIFVYERVHTVWRSGWKARFLAATLVPELAYEIFLQFVFAKSMVDIALGRNATWHHVTYAEIKGAHDGGFI